MLLDEKRLAQGLRWGLTQLGKLLILGVRL
jgi:hypothetical protein